MTVTETRSYFETRLGLLSSLFCLEANHILRMYCVNWEQMNKNDSVSIDLEA